MTMKINRFTFILISLIAIQLSFFITIVVGERRHRLQGSMITASKMAHVASSTTKDYFNQYLSIFNTLKSIDYINRQEEVLSSRIFQRLNEKYPDAVNFAALKKDGSFFASGKPLPKDKILNFKHFEFFKRIFSGEKMVIMQPHPGPISKELVTGLIVPLKTENGQINGTIGTSIKFQALIQHWNSIIQDQKILLVVHNGKGDNHFVSPGLKKIIDNDFLKSVVSGSEKKIKLGEMTYVSNTSRHLGSGWYFTVFVPAHSNSLDLLSSRKDLIFLLILMTITIATLGVWSFREKQLIEKLKSEQNKLQQSEERFEIAMSASQDGLYDWNLVNNTIYYSPGWKQMLGYNDNELPNDFSIWENLIAPKDAERSWKMQQELINKKRDRFELEFKMKHKEGHWIYILSRAKAIFDDKEKATRIIGTHVDITERKKAEEKLKKSEQEFRDLFNSISDLIYTQDMEGHFTSANPALQRLFGYKADEFVGHRATDFMEPELQSDFNSRYLGVIKKQGHCLLFQEKQGENLY